MAKKVDKRPLSPVAEWTIENFSCWNQEVHGSVISCPDFIPGVGFIKLHPRGTTGSGKISVTVISKTNSLPGDLSFIGPDGYVFCTRQITTDYYDVNDEYEVDSEDYINELFFKGVNDLDGVEDVEGEISSVFYIEDFMDQVGKDDDFHKDKLTLRFRLRGFYDYRLSMRTEICVHDITVKISSSLFDQYNISDLNEVFISDILHPFYEDKIPHLFLCAYVIHSVDYPYVEFELESNGEEKVLIRTCTSVLNKDDTVRKSQENQHVFHDGEPFMFSNNCVFKNEIHEEGVSLLVSLKIIPRKMNYFKFNYSSEKPDLVQITSTSSVRPHSFSGVVQKTSEIILKSARNQPENSKNVPSKCSSYNQPGNSVNVLTKELMCLYQDQDFSDITLKCDNVTFPVHKNILSARSPVFKTMFSTDMKETVSGEVDIEDLDLSTLARFLTYLYTGAVEEELHCDSALKLYYAADKYQVPSLKMDCSEFLCASVSISNVCDILSLADRHRDNELTTASHDFILNHFNEVLKSKEWNSFMEREALLAVKTVTHLATKDNVRK